MIINHDMIAYNSKANDNTTNKSGCHDSNKTSNTI